MKDVAQLVRSAQRVEVFTGAGMSAESGLDTFRDPQTGIWSRVDPTAMASIDAWARDPEPMWAWYLWRAEVARRAEPNAGHRAIARWAQALKARGGRLTVTTQNIDDLHERGGMTNVVHLHGSLYSYRCCMCARPWRGPVERLEEAVPRATPPACPLCGNLVRPGVVWFGEPLPHREWDEAERRMTEADLVVIVGTSGVVYPAAGLPRLAHELGTPIVEISPAPTELTPIASHFIEGTAATVLPGLADAC
ncbi:NAD-dependent deacylase [Corynebacterium endometrii]|uniref:NAD-dependent protein deacylase n=1 Tax=Corynebacterium endometrii TaxID=2488819 RepID=A0A4P7QDR8_9CORY|nr:NAD-dependent deacylase [Corynebacterium endometrii]QCB27420.1 NAD-dependent protein deacylase [Corynebacterium endometrii]